MWQLGTCRTREEVISLSFLQFSGRAQTAIVQIDCRGEEPSLAYNISPAYKVWKYGDPQLHNVAIIVWVCFRASEAYGY